MYGEQRHKNGGAAWIAFLEISWCKCCSAIRHTSEKQSLTSSVALGREDCAEVNAELLCSDSWVEYILTARDVSHKTLL